MIREMKSAYARAAAMRALYRQGHATSRQILETEYGVWPPKGVDHTDDNKLDTAVHLKPFYRDKDSGLFGRFFTGVFAFGYIHGKEQIAGSELSKAPEDQTIYMNPILLGPVGKIGSAYIAHGIATSFMANLTMAGIGAFLWSHKLLTATALFTSLRLLPLVQLAGMPFRPFSDVVGHEHVHILQIHDKKRADTGYAMDDNHFKNEILERHRSFGGLKRLAKTADSLISLGISRYLINDVEIQARMHTLMVRGYRRWGRLPETPTELKAALIDAGLNSPSKVWDEVAANPEDGVKDFLKHDLKSSFMRASRKCFEVNAAELNAAQRMIGAADLKQAFWDKTAPFMYGHLLELYGDERGLAKMGIDRSQHAFEPVEDDILELTHEQEYVGPWAHPQGHAPSTQSLGLH